MAAVCDVCGKGPGFGKSVSHSHVRTNRRWNPNIQRVRALGGGTPKRLNVCTKCLKSDKVVRAIGVGTTRGVHAPVEHVGPGGAIHRAPHAVPRSRGRSDVVTNCWSC